MAKCVSCDSWGKDCMKIYKAKCRECGALHCDECFILYMEDAEVGEWTNIYCDECDEEIWRKKEPESDD
jgi:hypothetical protein